MDKTLLLDQTALTALETCPRRFQLRYLMRLPWPSSPLDNEQGQAVERGRQFHRLLERHFLGLPVEAYAVGDDVLRDWWRRFEQSNLEIPHGRRWPEHGVTIPAGNHFLTGRFDLLVLGVEGGESFAQLFDWKTSKPHAPEALRSEWQTRLYLAMIAESGAALLAVDAPLLADRISITYWYAGEPDQPRVLSYDEAWHNENWAEIQALLARIDAADPEVIWPLTDDLAHCRSCMYQSYCGRQDAGTAAFLYEEAAPYTVESAVLLEPYTP